MNKLVKQAATKIPVFLFCVFYMSAHNKIFGQENSIVGVVFLIAFLTSFQNDFGYQTRQAVKTIPLLFLIVALGPKLSLMNPYFGLLINLVCILSILILCCHNVTMGNHVAYLMGYLMCQGYDVTGRAYLMRVLSLMSSAVIVMSIYYLMNRKRKYKRNIQDVFWEIDIHSTRTQWYSKLAITLSVVTFVGTLLQYPRIMWMNLVILSLVTPMEAEHKGRRISRIPATIFGTILFYMVFEQIVPEEYHQIIVLLAGFGSMFITSYFIKTVYNSFSALIAAALLFSTPTAMLLRVVSNILGVFIAVASNFIFNRFFGTLDDRELGKRKLFQ